jgi:hypothetical protein
MTPDEVLGRIEQSTGAAGMQPVRAQLEDGRGALVARTKQFRLRWMATQLHTFIVAAPFPASPSRGDLDFFIRSATQYAKANKGGLPLGFQTGLATIVVAVTHGASPEAVDWASSVHGRQFSAIPWPVLIDTAVPTLVQPQRMVIGGIYKAHLQQMVNAHVGRAISG